MAMVLPKLWSKCNNASLQATVSLLNKHNHLIKWKKQESILEFGFANGSNSALSIQPLLPKDYKEFVATDVSKSMIEQAQKLCKLHRSRIIQMDIVSTIPVEFQNRFDHVFGFLVIQRLKNPRKAFENIYGMLKPGGQMILTSFVRTPVEDVFERLSRHPKWRIYNQEEMLSAHYFSESPVEEYKKDLEAAAFKNYVLNEEKHTYTFPSVEECDNLVISVNSVIPRIPDEVYEEYIESYLLERDNGKCFDITYENGVKIITMNTTNFIVVADKD